jgi:hypothetical protein
MRGSRAVAVLLCMGLLWPEVTWALGSKKAMYAGGTLPGMKEKTEGKHDITNKEALVFTPDKGGGTVRVPWAQITDLEYGQRVSRRWKTAIFLSVFALFSRGRKHFVTITYKDPEGVDQATVFEFGKEVIRPTLAALKAKSGKQLTCQDEEAAKQMGGTCDTVLPPEEEEDKKN